VLGYPPPYGYGCFACLGAFGAVADFATWPRTAPPTRAGSMPAPPPKKLLVLFPFLSYEREESYVEELELEQRMQTLQWLQGERVTSCLVSDVERRWLQ
jgi:hypothetical protein